jgi:ferredoxin
MTAPWTLTLYRRRRDGTHEAPVTVPLHADQTLLAAARAGGAPLPAGCLTGACLTCAARLLTGRVHTAAGTALPDELAGHHIVLPCVTTASRDVALEVGPPDKPLLPKRLRRAWTD